MEEIIGFNNLKVGQQVKVKGTPGPEGVFAALEIEIRPPKNQAAIIGLLQNVDLRHNTLRILDRQITVPDASEITDLNGRLMGIVDLKPESRLKLKGTYSEPEGFMPEKIEVTEAMGFSIDKLEGAIDHLDVNNRKLRVNGFTVQTNHKTVIEGI
jgi:hypothetical protein